MPLRTLLSAFLTLSAALPAQDTPPAAPPAGERTPFKVADVIHPSVAALAAPTGHDYLDPVVLPVMTQSDEAKDYVQKGIALLDAAWDFEAYRHFCAAAQADPDCLMAYWGISMTIGSGLPEFRRQWVAATDRMIDLMGAKVEGSDEFVFSEYERSHAACAALLLTEGASSAAAAYRQMAEKFPNDVQSQVLAALLSIGGYDDFDQPRNEQELAESLVLESLKKNQGNQALKMTYLLVHSVMPDSDDRLRKMVIPFARQLAQGGCPTHQQLLSYLEWKLGNLLDAEKSAAMAFNGFAKYMQEQNVGIADCEKAMLCNALRALCLSSRGRTTEALKIAADLRALEIPVDRVNSVGGAVYLWDARTLEARLLLARGNKEDIARVAKVLPPPGAPELYNQQSASVVLIQALSLEAQVRLALQKKDVNLAATGHRALEALLENFSELRDPAKARGELTEWFRAFSAMRSTIPALRGHIARLQPEAQRKRAFLWFSSAAEKQQPANLFRAPVLLAPFHYETAREFLRDGKNDRAEEILRQGLVLYPNHLPSLRLLLTALEAQDKTDAAAQLKANIEALAS